MTDHDFLDIQFMGVEKPLRLPFKNAEDANAAAGSLSLGGQFVTLKNVEGLTHPITINIAAIAYYNVTRAAIGISVA